MFINLCSKSGIGLQVMKTCIKELKSFDQFNVNKNFMMTPLLKNCLWLTFVICFFLL